MLSGRGKICAVVTLAALALPALPAAAQAPTSPELILGGHLYPKPYGLAYVYGHVRVPPPEPPPGALGGQSVALFRSVFPFTTWEPVANLVTDWRGYFSYHELVGQNTVYRAIWNGIPSEEKLIKVPMKVSLRVRRRGHRRVDFSGTTYPLRPGFVVEIQRRDRHHRFKTVARARVGDQGYKRRLRLRRSGMYRALAPADAQYYVGVSRRARVKVKRRSHHRRHR